MYPASFDYHRPATLDEAIDAARGWRRGQAAGGRPQPDSGDEAPPRRTENIVDIGRVADLSYIRERGDGFAIGAMTTHYAVESSESAARALSVAARNRRAHRRRSGPQSRHNRRQPGSTRTRPATGRRPFSRSTRRFEIAGPKGRRTVRAEAFFVDLLQTALASDEVLCEIRVPASSRSVAYEKTEQKASGFALAGVAVVVGNPGDVRVGITGVGPKAYRANAGESALRGQALRPPSNRPSCPARR